MSWSCPECSSENDDDIVRCICGYENDPSTVAPQQETINYAEEDALIDQGFPEEFAKTLMQHSQELARVRSQSSLIPTEKYEVLRDFVLMLVWDCHCKATNAQESGRINEEQFFEIFFEYLYFYIHVIDRFAFASLGDPARHKLMTELGHFAVILSVRSLFPNLPDGKQDATIQEYMGRLNGATREYSSFQQLFSAGDEGSRHTLSWEFCSKIAQMKGEGSNPAAIIGHEYVLAAVLKSLDIKSFLEIMT